MSAQTDTPIAANIQAALLARLETLSPERQRQVLDFAEFLSEREEKAAVSKIQPEVSRPDMVREREHNWLNQHWREYLGQYVCLEGDRLVSSGADGRRVFAEARAAGIEVPFMVRVEDPTAPQMGGW
ncbi:MAG: hypothetical protein U0Z53_27685 [Blastocatellia bacterium]